MSDAAEINPLDESKLSPLEEQVLAQFTQREEQSAAQATDTPADEPASQEQPVTPAPEATSSPVPGGEGGEEQAPVPSGEPAPATPTTSVDEGAQLEQEAQTSAPSTPETPAPIEWDVYPEPFEAQQQAKELYDWSRSLTPQQMGAINQALSGDFVLVRADQVAQLQETYQRMEQWQQEQAQRARGGGVDEVVDPHLAPDEDTGDPILAAQLASTQAQVAQMQEQQMIAQLEQEVAAREQVIVSAQQNWLAEHPYLDDVDVAALEDQITTSGIFPVLFDKYGAEQATRMAFEQAAAIIPRTQQKILDARVAEQVAAGTQIVQAQQQNGTRASAIAGGATTPPDLSGMSADDAMVEEIRRAMYGN